MSTGNQASEELPDAEFSTDVGYFRQFLDALNSTREEGELTITEDAVYSEVVDPSNVMMCVARIQGKALNGLKVNGSDSVTMGANYEKISSLFSGISKNSELVFSYPVKESGRLDAKLDIVDEDIVFTTSTIDSDMVPDPPKDDPLAHPTQIKIEGSKIKDAIKHADKMSNVDKGAVEFGVDGDTFFIKTEDQVEGSFIKRFPQTEKNLGDMSTKISLGLLNNIKKSLGSSERVTIHIKGDNPIRFDADLDDEGNAQIVYLIAPRIES